MSTPKFTPTKWKMKFCQKHRKFITGVSWSVGYKLGICRRFRHSECEIIEVPNIPFKIPSLQLGDTIGGWIIAEDTMTGTKFPIAPSEIGDMIQNFGIPKGGLIQNQWWIWKGVGGATKTLHLLGEK